MEKPLTATERRIGQFSLRRDIAYNVLLADYERTLVWRCILFEGGGWSTKSLASYLRLPRSTIRRKVGDLVERGYIERRGEELHLTPRGRDELLCIYRSGLRIANGEQAGWPIRTINLVEEDGGYHPDSWDISFPPGPKWTLE